MKSAAENGVLAFGTKEFRNLVLLQSEVEVCGPVASSTWCGGNISLGRGVASAVVVGIEMDVSIIEVVVVMVILWGQINIVGSSCSSGHSCCVKDLNSLIKTPFVFVFSACCCGFVGVVSYVVVLGAVLESAY
jgi:hypothetical protein